MFFFFARGFIFLQVFLLFFQRFFFFKKLKKIVFSNGVFSFHMVVFFQRVFFVSESFFFFQKKVQRFLSLFSKIFHFKSFFFFKWFVFFFLRRFLIQMVLSQTKDSKWFYVSKKFSFLNPFFNTWFSVINAVSL